MSPLHIWVLLAIKEHLTIFLEAIILYIKVVLPVFCSQFQVGFHLILVWLARESIFSFNYPSKTQWHKDILTVSRLYLLRKYTDAPDLCSLLVISYWILWKQNTYFPEKTWHNYKWKWRSMFKKIMADDIPKQFEKWIETVKHEYCPSMK